MSEHTKEPWIIRTFPNNHRRDNYVMDATPDAPSGAVVAQVIVGPNTNPDHNANCARIVACVNALAGIPTDKLAEHVAAVARLREAAENVVRKEQQAREELMRLSGYDCPISDDMQELAAVVAAMEGK